MADPWIEWFLKELQATRDEYAALNEKVLEAIKRLHSDSSKCSHRAAASSGTFPEELQAIRDVYAALNEKVLEATRRLRLDTSTRSNPRRGE